VQNHAGPWFRQDFDGLSKPIWPCLWCNYSAPLTHSTAPTGTHCWDKLVTGVGLYIFSVIILQQHLPPHFNQSVMHFGIARSLS